MGLLTILASQTAFSVCFSKTMRCQPLSELLNTTSACGCLLWGHLSQLHAFPVSHCVPCQVWTPRIQTLVLCPGLRVGDSFTWTFCCGLCPLRARDIYRYLHSFPSFAVGQILAPHLVPSGLPRLKKKKKITTHSQNKGGPGGDFSKPRPWRRDLRKTDSTLLVWGWKEMLRMMHITQHLTSFPCLKYLAHCSFRAKLWDSDTLSEQSLLAQYGTTWIKYGNDHQNEPD